MAKVELIMPKLGESVMEATILEWLKKEGEEVEVDEDVLLIATDKVDTEVPSPVAGTIEKIMFPDGEVVSIGEVIAIIQTEGEEAAPEASPTVEEQPKEQAPAVSNSGQEEVPATAEQAEDYSKGNRFYSPLVRSMAEKEGISLAELEQIQGSGKDGRVTKDDMLAYIEGGRQAEQSAPVQTPVQETPKPTAKPQQAAGFKVPQAPPVDKSGNVELIEMDRMRKMIAEHMVMSKHVSPHVTSFVEADVTNIVNWRKKNKQAFQERYGEKVTYTPIFIEAVVRALKDFPMVNVSVEGTTIIKRNDINIGMATALPSGNLIVPVIKNADFMNLPGLTKQVNDLANRARNNKLKPDEVQGGTFTVTNVGTFGNVMGTPIINQPQVAILAVGAIRKKPAVLETEHGDVIAVRHQMFLSLSYDHRVVDGALGGAFLRRIGDYLESFDPARGL